MVKQKATFQEIDAINDVQALIFAMRMLQSKIRRFLEGLEDAEELLPKNLVEFLIHELADLLNNAGAELDKTLENLDESDDED